MNNPTTHPYDYTVIGGDRRQVYLAEQLAEPQIRLCHFALCQTPRPTCLSPSSTVTAMDSLEEACLLSASIIAPIPLCQNGVFLNQAAIKPPIPLEQIVDNLHPGQSFFGGCIPQEQKQALIQKGVRVYDLMEDASLSYYNTIATAEGAICEAIKNSPQNLHHSACAILGYGKCGYTLCQYLKGMACHTYVAARREEIRVKASILSDETGSIDDFLARIYTFDFIFNTIPARLLTAPILSRLNPTATVIDIASAPGGVDLEAAKTLDIAAFFCPGLPGIYAPASSAAAIKRTIESICQNRPSFEGTV